MSINNEIPEFIRSKEYKFRRFLNWFPLGLTYALYYMGRYNVSVASPEICKMFSWTNAQWGIVITAGFWVYAFSVMINGPLTDKFGGKKAIIIGAVGSAILNTLIGLLILGGINTFGTKLLLAFSFLYSINMYFQSFGAASVVKVNTPWFHVKERGTFGGIFGSLISIGYKLSYGVGGIIMATLPIHYIFIIPTIVLLIMVLIDVVFIKDTPEQAGFQSFDTGDVSSGIEKEFKLIDIIKLLFSRKTVIIAAFAEFCTGIVRNGIMQWLPKYVNNVFHVDKHDPSIELYGTGLFILGILGGIIAGFISDKYFDSRRPPVAGIFYICMIGGLILLSFASSPIGAVISALIVSFFFIGIHGLLSGTTSMDFGGKKAAATAAGIIDGFVYFGSGFSGFFLGFLIDKLGWGAWAYLLIPFAVIGFILTLIIWKDKPIKVSIGH